MNSSRLTVNGCRLVLFALSAACSFAAGADEWAPNATATAVWDTNATHADDSDDEIDSVALKADVLASRRFAFGGHDALYLRGHFAGDWWPRYADLLSGAIGGRADWQHTFGTGPLAPIVSLEGAVDGVETRESFRRGIGMGATLSVRKRFNSLTRATISHEVAWFDADRAAFDRGASETAIQIDRDLTDVARLTFTARFRDGDVVSYASGFRPDLEALAPHRLAVTTFGRPMTAYRIDARMWSGRIAFVRAVDDATALVLAYERREAEQKSFRFGQHLVSLGFVHQF